MLKKWCVSILASGVLSAPVVAECPPPISTSEIEVFPSAQSLPENLLRFYLYFPRSMSREIASSDILLVNPEGLEVTQAFLPMRFELWSPDRRRLTLILDPGRVKTGLRSHNALGRALTAGEGFELRVPGTLKDSEGCGLLADTSFDFSVRPADLQPPAPKTWSIAVPSAETREALKVDLGRPHDHLSLAFRIRVKTREGQSIAGRIGFEANESVWTFVPRDNWKPAPHSIVIDERLEDLSGNRPGVAFDRPPGTQIEEWARELTFTPRQ